MDNTRTFLCSHDVKNGLSFNLYACLRKKNKLIYAILGP